MRGVQPVPAQPADQLCCALNIHRSFSSPAKTPPQTERVLEVSQLTTAAMEVVETDPGIPSLAS